MAYVINKSDGTNLTTIQDAAVDTTTSLALVGRNYVGYGEIQNENFLFLLESFANESPPARPIAGQIWFDSTLNILKVYDGAKWVAAGAAAISQEAPATPPTGALWYKQEAGTLHIFNGNDWTFIGPETAEGFQTTAMKSGNILADSGIRYPIVRIFINGIVVGIIANIDFTIDSSEAVPNFTDIKAGLNMSTAYKFVGNLDGNATSATRLQSPALINGVAFSGDQNVTVKAETSNRLISGDYITGADFDGSAQVTWSVDATSSNNIGKIVLRDSAGDFSANNITANLIGNVTGNVTAATGTSNFNVVQANQFIGATLTGNAATATRLSTPRRINGTAFDGTENITVNAAADGLTGTFIANNVVSSNLQAVGTLASLNVDGKITLASNLELFGQGEAIIAANSIVRFRATDSVDNFTLELISNDKATEDGYGPNGGLVPQDDLDGDLGKSTKRFDNVYSRNFAGDLTGNAATATLATRSTNLAGGVLGAVPYQFADGTTRFTPTGSVNQVLKLNGDGEPRWGDATFAPLEFGDYLDGNGATEYPGTFNVRLDVDATPANTAGKVVARDNNGDFVARNITANLIGNANTATELSSNRTINGVVFDASQNITITAEDPNAVDRTGDTMTGRLTLSADPTQNMHAATKRYVDQNSANYTFVYKDQVTVGSYTNQVGSFNNSRNFFDVYPPSGKTMSDLVAFIASIGRIHYAGGVDGNDSIRCEWDIRSDRIRVWVQGTEQRAKPRGNYLAIWSN